MATTAATTQQRDIRKTVRVMHVTRVPACLAQVCQIVTCGGRQRAQQHHHQQAKRRKEQIIRHRALRPVRAAYRESQPCIEACHDEHMVGREQPLNETKVANAHQTVSTALPSDGTCGASSCGATARAPAGAMSTACATFALNKGSRNALVSSLLTLRRVCKPEQRTCAAPAANRASEESRAAQLHQHERATAQRASLLQSKQLREYTACAQSAAVHGTNR